MSDQAVPQKGSYDASSMPGGLDTEIERLRQQALLMWDKEASVLDGFGLRDGMSILEVGPGPGFVTEELLQTFPTSHVTTVELDPVLLERARGYLKGKADDRLHQVEGSIMKMDLPDNTFDFAFGRLLFQHLPDPVGAAREVLRVLKPGGKLAIADIDDSLHIFDPAPTPEEAAIQERFRQLQASRGGNRHVGRLLPRILKEAGFTNLDLQAIVDHSEIIGINTLLPPASEEVWRSDVERGTITEEEMQMMIEGQRRFYSSDPIVALFMLLACGEKPAAAEGDA